MKKDPRSFDATKALVASAFSSVHEHELTVGTPIVIVEVAEGQEFGKGEVTLDEAIHLWRADKIDYLENAAPTPVAKPEDEAERLTEMEELGGGWYLIRAPWLPEGVKVQGQEAADAAYADAVQQGIVDATPAVPVVVEGDEGEVVPPVGQFQMNESGSNGYYEISGPGVEPYKIRGKDAAQAEVDKLNGVEPPATPTDEVEQED